MNDGSRLDPETIAIAALDRLAREPEKLTRFLDMTGVQIGSLRGGLSDGTLLPALLHHLLHEEDLLVAVAQDLGRKPDAVAAAADRDLNPEVSS